MSMLIEKEISENNNDESEYRKQKVYSDTVITD